MTPVAFSDRRVSRALMQTAWLRMPPAPRTAPQDDERGDQAQ